MCLKCSNHQNEVIMNSLFRSTFQIRWGVLFTILTLFVSCSNDNETNDEPVIPALIFDGDVLLETQTEVDAFAAIGYTEITGNLQIFRKFQTTDPIMSLSDLSTITVVGGDVHLNLLSSLNSLDGLHNLESISGTLRLYFNSLITSLEAFSGVTSTLQSLEIIANYGIENLNGLERLTISSGGTLIISGNENLEDVLAIKDRLPAVLATIHLDYNIEGCGPACDSTGSPPTQPFDSLEFLENVTEVEWLRIRGFVGTDLSGLENLTTVNRLAIWVNENLMDIQAVSGVTSDVGFILVAQNGELESLDGLENIGVVTERLSIKGNEMLTDLCALQGNISPSLPDEGYDIDFNAFNPTEQDIMNGNCSN